MVTNKHGLSRNVPTDVIRRVRQECFFGCVVCGAMPAECEHFDPEFADAKQHDPAGIALLCPTHHADKTGGRLSAARVRQHRQNPFNKDKNPFWRTALGPGEVRFNIGGNVFSGSSAGLSINGSPVLHLVAPEGGGVWQLTGSLVSEGKEFLRFEDNVVTAFSGSWDVHLAGTRLTVKDKKDEGRPTTVASICFDAEAGEVRIEHLALGLAAGQTLLLSPKGLQVKDATGRTVIDVAGNEGHGDWQDGSLNLGLDGVGTYEDWLKK